jgi:asparagine synthetase B (glutamine-hydrolysing)
MCGIGGFYRYGDTPIDIEEAKSLLVQLEKRGTHATGLAVMYDNGDTVVYKKPVPAWQLVSEDDFDKFAAEHWRPDARIVLLHTRWFTVGNPNNNENNHPIHDGKGAIVHNGAVSNHHNQYHTLDIKRGKAETDSDVYRAIVDKHGITPEAVRTFDRLWGASAIAAIHPEYPGKMIVGRSGKPLVFGWNPKTKMFAFASEKDILYMATKPVEAALGFFFGSNKTDYLFWTPPPDTAFIIGPGGKEWHGKMKTAQHTSDVVYRCRENYFESKKRLDREVPPKELPAITVQEGPIWVSHKLNVVECRNPECKQLLKLNPEQLKIPLYELQCTKCDTTLMDAPAVRKVS